MDMKFTQDLYLTSKIKVTFIEIVAFMVLEKVSKNRMGSHTEPPPWQIC